MKQHYLTLILAVCMSLLPFARGYAQDSETYSEPLNAIPAGWILDDGLSISGGALFSNTQSSNTDNMFEGALRAITPKLKFNEGESLTLQMKGYNAYYSLSVMWSPDRANWQKVYTVARTKADKTLSSGAAANRSYDNITITGIPTEEGYIALELNKCFIRNFKGGVLVPVEFDAYISASNFAPTAPVNNLYTPSVVFNNLGNAIESTAYTAALYGALKTEGVEPEFTKLADIETVNIPAQSNVEFKASWMPHVPGEYVMYIAIDKDGEIVSGQQVDVSVVEESTISEVKVGNTTAWDKNAGVMDFGYFLSQSQTVYTQEELAEFGITPGTRIAGARYRGYTTLSSDKDINAAYQVGIQAYDGTTLDTSAPVAFTKYQGTGFFEKLLRGTSADNPQDIIDVDFMGDDVFEYTGGSIVVEVSSPAKCTGYTSAYYFEGTAGAANTAMRKSDDNDLNNKSFSYLAYKPVVYFKTLSTPMAVSGEVTYQEEAVAGAVITLESDGVIYSGTSDEQGHYSINVVQSDRIYNVTATAEGHPEFKGEQTVSFAEGNVTYNIAFGEWPFVSGVVTTAAGEKAAEAAVVLSIDDVTFATTTDEQGAYKVQVDRHNATFNVSVDYAKSPIYAGTVEVADADVTNNIQLADFTKERLYTLSIAVTDVRGKSLEGVAYTLKSDKFDETYPAEETKLDAEGKSTVTVYGGANTFTLTMPGMKTLEATVDVNKAAELTLTLTEDVNVPEIKGFEIDHDIMTGENDVLVWWNEDLPAVEEEGTEAPARSAANPAEKFVISLDGEEIGETESYYYVLENVATGAHEISIVAKYDVAQSEAAKTTVTINADDYVKVTFNITTNNDESTDGLMLAIAEKAEAGDEYEIQVLNGVVEIPYLPKGTYLVEMEAPAAYTYTAWDARELTITEETTVDIEFKEVLGAPADLKAETAQNDGTEHFNIDLTWGHEEGFNGKVQSYDILLDGEKVASTSDKAYTLAQVAAGAHTIGVRANYISGASDVTEQNVNLVSGINGIDAEGETGDVYTPAGLLIKRDATLKEVKTLPAGLYIFRGRKVIIK